MMRNTKKKIVLVGGSKSTHLKNYYFLIKDYFDEVLIITDTEIDYCNHTVVDFSIKNIFSIKKRIKAIYEIIKKNQPNMIHVHQANSFAYLTIRANKDKLPLVLTTWGSDVLILPKKGFIYKHMVRYNLSRADYITADAKFMIKAIKKMVGDGEVLLANFGIDFENIEIPEKENIIYSNRLHNDLYNIDEVINTFSIFQQTNKNWKLIIAANGSNTEKLKELAESVLQKGTFQFVGFVNHEVNKNYYLKSKIWLSIPSSDGTAISLLEAMGYGCIPVVSNLPANLEWIVNNENGIIVNDGLLNALERVSDISLLDLQSINKQLIINNATKMVNRNKFESIYNKILNYD